MKNIEIAGRFSASQTALGCMRMAGRSEAEVDTIIYMALECGINYFDHADIYGGGESERLFGGFLKRHPAERDRMLIQTKCGIRPGCYDFSKEHIVKAAEGSLLRLGIDRLDALLLHRPDTLMIPGEVASAFDYLEDTGKVTLFGVSNHGVRQTELLKTAVRQPLKINQLQFSLTEAGMVSSGMNANMKNAESVMHDDGILEYSRINGITIQAWSPFQYGFFEGNYIGSEKYPRLNAVLQKLSAKYGISLNGIAASWIMRHPAGIQVIAGTMNPEHLKQICSGADITLTHDEWYEIYTAEHRLP